MKLHDFGESHDQMVLVEKHVMDYTPIHAEISDRAKQLSSFFSNDLITTDDGGYPVSSWAEGTIEDLPEDISGTRAWFRLQNPAQGMRRHSSPNSTSLHMMLTQPDPNASGNLVNVHDEVLTRTGVPVKLAIGKIASRSVIEKGVTHNGRLISAQSSEREYLLGLDPTSSRFSIISEVLDVIARNSNNLTYLANTPPGNGFYALRIVSAANTRRSSLSRVV